MNGPQHYAEAERLLDATAALLPRGPVAVDDVDQFHRNLDRNIAFAQVHATLALAAATAEASGLVRAPLNVPSAWARVTA